MPDLSDAKDGRVDKIYYPAAGGQSLGWNEATDQQWNELVVILSSSTLDLRNGSERPV
ncbi:hypothetical protein P3T23_001021 [Paraburkholderia sp. GAS448]